MKSETLAIIDDLAVSFKTTNDKRYFNEFLVLAEPIVRQFISKARTGASWDVEELYSVLICDQWRLFQRFEVVEGKKFHWLMFRQLKNKIIDWITEVEGLRPLKICPTCGYHHKIAVRICIQCSVLMKAAHKKIQDILDTTATYDTFHSYTPDYLERLVQQDLVRKVLQQCPDLITRRIIGGVLRGESRNEIGRNVGLTSPQVKRKLKGLKNLEIIKEIIQ